MESVTPQADACLGYGQRLWPHIIDSTVEADPERVVGLIGKSSDISQGFTKVTIADVQHAMNYMAWWLEEKAGATVFETVAYMVRIVSIRLLHKY